MRTVTQLRAVIDGFAAQYAAARVAEGVNPAPLLQIFSRLQKASQAGDYDRFIEADQRLHWTIVELADVRGLPEVWRTITQYHEAFRLETIRRCWPDLNVLFEGHRALVDTICDGDQNGAEDAAKAHLNAVWYRLAEYHNDASLPNNPLARACAYLAFHLHETVRLGFLAKYIAKTSTGHLSRLFREEYGVSFTKYVRELRMQKSVEMLIRSRMPISRIATSVGYQDGSRFAKHFHKRFDFSPGAYRKHFGHDPHKSG